MNKYEQNLLQNCSRLDAVTNSNGDITNSAKDVIENNIESSKLLCKFIERAADLKNPQITKIAIAAKDSLICFYGHRHLTQILSNTEPKEEHYTFEELMLQLNQLVGLSNVKSQVLDLIAYQKVQLLRKEKGLHSPKRTMHLAFIGNPGTGKTTVARIVGRIYKELGLLSKSQFMEVSRTDLIAGYQGQTAHKVKDVIEKAKGGVLFIDEAYSITENDHSDSYGRECLTELTKALEDYREDLVVIVAGYIRPMKHFFESNPGLKSRFNTFIEFDDYNANELLDIIRHMSKKEDYVLTDKVQDALLQLFSKAAEPSKKEFANGRFVRNIFESMIINQARRIFKVDSPTLQELKELIENDLPILSHT
ncbi:AAA family ATPase [Bacteroides sp. 224]|nr:AAA family ATPase [Bacteroides sp. 224]